MTAIEELEREIIKLHHKSNMRIEKNKRLRDINSPGFDEFQYAKVWGAYQAYGTVLGLIKKIK